MAQYVGSDDAGGAHSLDVVEAAEQTGEHYSAFQRLLIKYAVVPAMREAVLLLRGRFNFLKHEVEPGPGRFDTFNPAKALLNWPFEQRMQPR